MNFFPLLTSLLILVNGNTPLLAKNKSEIKIHTSQNTANKNDLEDENEAENEKGNKKEDTDGQDVSIQTQSENSSQNSVRIENDKFEIVGQITAVSSNSFSVNNQSISIDPSLVKSYRQKGILEVGKQVKVKGTIKDSILYASDVKVMEGNLGNFKIDIKKLNSSTAPTPTSDPNASPTPTVDPSVTLSPTATATLSANANVKIKAHGPVDQVILFLQQVLSFLQNLL